MKPVVDKQYAPIALFAFKRPEHTRLTLESLAHNPEFMDSPLFIYCDGTRDSDEEKLVSLTRKLVHELSHPNKTIIERDNNWGLAESIIAGVTQLCDEYEKVIVLEDDMVISPCFLRYMNSSLVEYEYNNCVISIHGYCFPIEGMPETYFLMGADCWGWATWKNRWDLFEKDGRKLLRLLNERGLINRFNMFGSYNYSRMLKQQIAGKNESWAIRWYASALLNEKLTLYPGKSLVQNIGNDSSGRHCVSSNKFDIELSRHEIHIGGIDIDENEFALQKVCEFLNSTKPGYRTRAMAIFNRLLGTSLND